jgi:hypothetical protein
MTFFLKKSIYNSSTYNPPSVDGEGRLLGGLQHIGGNKRLERRDGPSAPRPVKLQSTQRNRQ